MKTCPWGQPFFFFSVTVLSCLPKICCLFISPCNLTDNLHLFKSRAVTKIETCPLAGLQRLIRNPWAFGGRFEQITDAEGLSPNVFLLIGASTSSRSRGRPSQSSLMSDSTEWPSIQADSGWTTVQQHSDPLLAARCPGRQSLLNANQPGSQPAVSQTSHKPGCVTS